MLLLLRTPEPEYRMSKLYVEVTSADSVGREFSQSVSVHVTVVMYLIVKKIQNYEF